MTLYDYNYCHLLWHHSSVFQSFPSLLNQITTLPRGEYHLKITMDRFNDFVIFIYCVKNSIVVFDKMIYFISLFCTALPIIIVLLLFVLTWKLLHGANKGGRYSARFSSKPRHSRHHRTTANRASTNVKNDVSLCAPPVNDTSLHVLVSTELHKTQFYKIWIQQYDINKEIHGSVISIVERKLLKPCLV